MGISLLHQSCYSCHMAACVSHHAVGNECILQIECQAPLFYRLMISLNTMNIIITWVHGVLH